MPVEKEKKITIIKDKVIIDEEEYIIKRYNGGIEIIDDDTPFRCTNINCDHFFEILQHVLVNGYPFGGRLLENIMFVVKNIDQKPVVTGITKESKRSFNKLNKEMWIEKCMDYCKDLDIAQCPYCMFDVLVWSAYQ